MKNIIIFLWLSIISSTVDYSKVWPDRFPEAVQFVESQSSHIYNVFGDDAELAAIAISIGFPELIRYNSIKDIFETKSLELAYVKLGLDAVDFSIGEFQMKPSFCEALENELNNYPDLLQLSKLLDYQVQNNESIRRERIKRLKSKKWQLIYLKIFTSYMFERYPNLKKESPEYIVRFLSSAYNYGFQSTFLEIDNWITIKAFPHGLKANIEQYSYADIAAYYYLEYSSHYKKILLTKQ
jgi:hypothetical protein